LKPDSKAAPDPLVLQCQGSFFIGGRQVKAAGNYDELSTTVPDGAGQTYWIDQMYVQYQVPPNARQLPIVLVHGGGGTGQVWESTPDGREGFQSLLLRRGYTVYIVDAPRGGRSGFPSFNGPLGHLDGSHQLVPNHTRKTGREHAWSRWRLGPRYPEVFPVQAFPMKAVESFLQHVRPLVSDDPDVVAGALVALLEKIGAAILVTHSNSGLWGWLAAARSPHVRAIVSYEPAVVFPRGHMPPPVPLYKGSQAAGIELDSKEFSSLAKIPVQIVFGDNIPSNPVPELPADGRRAQVISARMFAEALNHQGGRASVLLLSEVGLQGNSHFPFSDLNNIGVTDQLTEFFAEFGLDGRAHEDRRLESRDEVTR
jgi:pimeloyl-ACP methyl ester carboxylesterase